MKRWNWIVGSLLGLVLVAAIVAVFCNPGLHYQLFHDEISLNAVMSRLVKPEDSVAHVTSLLGRGEQVSEPERQEFVRGFHHFFRKDPDYFPDGVTDDDGILNYRVKGGVTIQIGFRDGKLVNFHPKDFEQPYEIHLINP